MKSERDLEQFILSVLRKLARQRVALILQPGNVWVIEKAIQRNDDVDEALRTCHLRGWVEPIENAIPKIRLGPDGLLPPGPENARGTFSIPGAHVSATAFPERAALARQHCGCNGQAVEGACDPERRCAGGAHENPCTH